MNWLKPMMSVLQFHNIAIQTENITEYRLLEKGDQLAAEGEHSGVEYYHHGIFLGHDKGIASLGGANKKDAKIRVVDILQFTNYGRRRLLRINYPKGQCLPPEVAVENAERLVANPSRWGEYDLLKNNCEHFATKCKTGIAVSFQVIEKIRSCLYNPLQLFRYVVVSSVQSGSGSFGSFGSGLKDVKQLYINGINKLSYMV